MTEGDVGRDADGGQRAFLDATLPHVDAVYRIARHLSGDRSAAEDLVQETYLRALAAFRGRSGAGTGTWLVTICTNLARSQWRERARRPRLEPTDPPGGRLADLAAGRAGLGADAAGALRAHVDEEAVAAALAELPEEQRTAIVLIDLAGRTASEVASMLRWSRGTVLARAHRGRRRLARILAEQGYDRGLL